MASNTSVITSAAMIILLTVGIGVGWGFRGTEVQTSGGVTTTTSSSAALGVPYMITLVETMQNLWNASAGMQPKFFVLGSHGLESSANISLPADTLIQLTIACYDTADPQATNDMGVVRGTVGGTVYVLNGTIASGTGMGALANRSDWGKTVTAVPASELAHTFTIGALGISVPVVAGSTVIAYLNIHQKGTFAWICLTPCGLGPSGLLGAMETRGWMTGNVEVS